MSSGERKAGSSCVKSSELAPTSTLASLPALSLELTLLLMGVGFAIPFPLNGSQHPWVLEFAPAVRNLYGLTAWMGMAHFVYAYRGQGLALLRPGARPLAFWGVLLLAGIAQFLLRASLGISGFSALAWLYFMQHFVKAEAHLNSLPSRQMSRAYQALLLAFAWLTVVLYNAGNVQQHQWLVFAVPLLIGA
jgi:hypothetical protein